jgi:hypothetical protein
MKRNPGPRRTRAARELLRTLDLVKWVFDPGSERSKLNLLRGLERARFTRPADWLCYHDALCVLRTYPDSERLMRSAERALRSLPRRLRAYLGSAPQAARLELRDSGLAHTDVVHPYSLELCERLVRRYPGRLDIDWEEALPESLDGVLRMQSLLVTWAENDSLDYDVLLEAQAWLQRVRTRSDRTALEALLRILRTSRTPRAVQRHLFDELDLPIRFKPGAAPISRTRHRLPQGTTFLQNQPVRGRSTDLRTALRARPGPLRNLREREGQAYIDALQDAHAVRNRELFPVIFANPHEAYLYEAGRGLRFVLFGMQPEMRLPFESNFGGILVRNGMPLGYCIAAPWFDRSEIAINVFPAYRSGESAFVFEQFALLLHRHFGVQAFYVRSHQMGEDDPEPLESGAFWFYYKLGFRALNPRVYALAEREALRIRHRPGYRSPMVMLKRLSHTDVKLHVDPRLQARYTEPPLVKLAYAVTDWFTREALGDRRAGTAKAVAAVTRQLGLGSLRTWSESEKTALARWAPLLVQVPGLARWNGGDRAHLAAIVRAKGGGSERDYIRLCQSHPRLLAGFRQVARDTRG